MITAELHNVTDARAAYYQASAEARREQASPWVTVEVYDSDGGTVVLFLDSPDQIVKLRTAAQVAGILLATGAQAHATVRGET